MRGSAVVFVFAMLAAAPAAARDVAPAVSDCWTDDYIASHYPREAPGSTKVPSPLAVNTGVVLSLGHDFTCDEMMGFDNVADPMNYAAMNKIAERCKSAYPNQTYLQIKCASEGVDRWVSATANVPVNGVGVLTSNCRDHERAFRQVMDIMKLPGVSVGVTCIKGDIWDPQSNKESAGHIANTVTVTGADGKTYQYVVDTLYDPSNVTPMPGDACTYFLDHRDAPLPPLKDSQPPPPAPPFVSILPTSIHPLSDGFNRDRGSNTTPSSTSPAGSSSGGGTKR